MSVGAITAVSIAVEIAGKAYFVNLPHDRMLILMKMAEGLSDSGKLGVVAAPAGYSLTPIGMLK
jgi:hypothetical protein